MSRRKTKSKQAAEEPRAAAEQGTEEPDAAGEGLDAEARPAEEDLEDWKDRALRAQAEMVNMRRRLEHEVEERTRMRMESLFSELITLHDHLELAVAAIPVSLHGDAAAASFVDGVKAIHAGIDALMARHGLQVIHPGVDQAFDPEHHEAVHTEEREELDAEQLELVRRGYRMGRRILRPAQVKLLRPPTGFDSGTEDGAAAAAGSDADENEPEMQD